MLRSGVVRPANLNRGAGECFADRHPEGGEIRGRPSWFGAALAKVSAAHRVRLWILMKIRGAGE